MSEIGGSYEIPSVLLYEDKGIAENDLWGRELLRNSIPNRVYGVLVEKGICLCEFIEL